MKKVKNLKNSFADNMLFVLYLCPVIALVIWANEAYQIERIRQLRLAALAKAKKEQKIVTEAPKIQYDVFKIVILKGKVEVLDPVTEKPVLTDLKEGDMISSGNLLRTGDDSFVVLSFGSEGKSHLKIGRYSEIVLTYKGSGIKKGIYNQATEVLLNNGSILFDIKEKYKKDNFSVRTRNAVMGVRGTIFLVSYNRAMGKVAAAVDEGKIAMMNIVNKSLRFLVAGEGMMILKNGFEIDLNILKFLPNFDIFNDKKRLIDEQALKDLGEKIKEEKEKKAKEKKLTPEQLAAIARAKRLRALAGQYRKLLDDFDIYLENQQFTLLGLEQKNNENTKKLKLIKKKLKKQKVEIEKDLVCLQTGVKKCNLYTRDLLTRRGYARIMFNDKMRKSMSRDLLMYIDEQEDKIENLQNDIKLTKKKIDELRQKLQAGKSAKMKVTNINENKQLKSAVSILKSGTEKSGAFSILDDVKRIESELKNF